MLFLIAGATTKKSLITTQKASSRATLNVSSTKVSINSLNRMCRMFPVASQYCKTSFSFSDSTVGGWFLPGQTPICPSSSPPQFSGTAGHSSGSYCERYSSLRSHRAAPYPSHYSHRTSSTSKSPDMYIYTQQQKKVGELILKRDLSSLFPDNYMDNTSGTLPAHDSWSALQIPNSTGMGTLSHSTNSTSNSR